MLMMLIPDHNKATWRADAIVREKRATIPLSASNDGRQKIPEHGET
jgi:hypothetical protein